MARFESVVSPDAPLSEAIPLMNGNPGNRFIAGIVVLVDAEGRVTGSLSDGDIRRGLSQGKGNDTKVLEIANPNPVVVRDGMSRSEMRQEIVRRARLRNRPATSITKIIVVDDEQRFVDVVWGSEILAEDVTEKTIGVYGLGSVGLTLAAVLASSDLNVCGVDTDPKVIEALSDNRATLFEQGLESLLQTLATTNPIRFVDSPVGIKIDVHIVAVGTSIDANQKPVLAHITDVAETIAQNLCKGDLVVIRSSVPVGTTRQVVVPILSRTGLRAGLDFYVAFAPERTTEGRVLDELRTLPQIIGGINQRSYELAAQVFRRISRSIVEVESLEAAEMVKLMNNTYRDLVFAFANEVASVCDSLNLNAFKLIQSANEGYPRNPIPMPSPGVGGSRLTRDPYLFCASVEPGAVRPGLGLASRAINSRGHEYVLEKLEYFAHHTSRRLDELQVFIIGVAFKGSPATGDIENSVAVNLIKSLPDRSKIAVKDFVVSGKDLATLDVRVIDDIYDGFRDADVVLVMNNHEDNARFNLYRALTAMHRPGLLFDGWNLFNQTDIEHIGGVYYATMGYVSKHGYYSLRQLREGHSITFGSEIQIDLDAVSRTLPAVRDDELKRDRAKTFLWLSGGGSLLLEDRYLLVVQRPRKGVVNPGKVSLFTGRADGPVEWRQPLLLLRELFEELIAVDNGGRVLVPRLADNCFDAHAVYTRYMSHSSLAWSSEPPLELAMTDVGTKPVRIISGGNAHDHEVLLHVGTTGDLNALYVLRSDRRLEDFWAIDGEPTRAGQRPIYALDLKTMVATQVTYGSARATVQFTLNDLTEHCRFLVSRVRERMI